MSNKADSTSQGKGESSSGKEATPVSAKPASATPPAGNKVGRPVMPTNIESLGSPAPPKPKKDGG